MKYTDEEIQEWINNCDPDLLYESQEEFIDEENIDFSKLYKLYNEKSLIKYGYKLNLRIL